MRGGFDLRGSLMVHFFSPEEACVVEVEVTIDGTSIEPNLPQCINLIEVSIALDLCQRNRDRFRRFFEMRTVTFPKSPSILASGKSTEPAAVKPPLIKRSPLTDTPCPLKLLIELLWKSIVRVSASDKLMSPIRQCAMIIGKGTAVFERYSVPTTRAARRSIPEEVTS